RAPAGAIDDDEGGRCQEPNEAPNPGGARTWWLVLERHEERAGTVAKKLEGLRSHGQCICHPRLPRVRGSSWSWATVWKQSPSPSSAGDLAATRRRSVAPSSVSRR